MNDEKWLDLVDDVRDKYGSVELTKEEISESDDVGREMKGTLETLQFTSPMGEMKIERYTRPKILDKKTHYNRTQSSGARVEYVLSPDEFVHQIRAFKKDALTGEYEEIREG